MLAGERSPELDIELADAYPPWGEAQREEKRALYKKVIDLPAMP